MNNNCIVTCNNIIKHYHINWESIKSNTNKLLSLNNIISIHKHNTNLIINVLEKDTSNKCLSKNHDSDRIHKLYHIQFYDTTYSNKLYNIISTELNMINQKVLIILNPVSGKHNSANIYNSILSILQSLNWSLDVKYTDSVGSGIHIIKELDIVYDRIIIFGGDGLVNEVCHGIVQYNYSCRNIGIIPTGTGNGLAKSSLYDNHENYGILSSLYCIIKYKPKPIDVAMINSSQFTKYSILSTSWAIVSDVDIGSEKLRCLGSMRFILSALYNILCRKSYNGVLDYKINNTWYTVRGGFILLWICNTSHMSYNMFNIPNAKLNDGMFHIMIIKDNINRMKLMELFLKMETGKHVYDDNLLIIQTTTYRFTPKDINSILSVDGERVPTCPIESHMTNEKIMIY